MDRPCRIYIQNPALVELIEIEMDRAGRNTKPQYIEFVIHENRQQREQIEQLKKEVANLKMKLRLQKKPTNF